VRLFSPAYDSDALDLAPREVHEPLPFS